MWDDEQKVPCPYCQVPAGQRCVRANGTPVGAFPHGLRRDLAVIEGHLPDRHITYQARQQITRWKAMQEVPGA